MMSDREKKVLCFGVAIGILLGVVLFPEKK